jgi:AcrR family transcriptional regulator
MSPRAVVEEQQEARKAQLIRATLKEVSEKGFSNVTLDDIATAAGLSKGVALYYFESKEELFLAAFQSSIGMVRERLRAAISAVQDPAQQIRAIIRTTFVSIKDNRNFYRAYLDFMSLGTRHPEYHRLNAAFYKGCLEMDDEVIQKGIQQGLFRPGSEPAVFRAIFDGLMLQWLFDEPNKFEEYRARCEKAVLAYLGR